MRPWRSLNPNRMVAALRCIAYKHPFALSAAVVLVAMIAIAFCRGIVFETVDDYNVMMTLSGEKTGAPYAQLTFYNTVLGFLIAQLYRITDVVQWYSLVQLAMIYASCTATFGSILKSSSRTRIPLVATALFSCIFFIVFLLYPTQRMQFTTTAAMLGMAACSLCFSIDPKNDCRASVNRTLLASCVFVVLAFAERRSVGICVLVFWAASFVRLYLFAKPLSIKSRDAIFCIASASITVALCGGLAFVDSVVRSYGDNRDYVNYNEWRVEYQDHPHPSFSDASDLYKSIGWDGELYDLTTSLIYIDDRINESSFETIMTSPYSEAAQTSVNEAIALFVRLARENQSAKALTLGLLALFATSALLGLGLISRDQRRAAIVLTGSLGLLAVTIVLSLYLCLSGRWMLRLYQTIVLPAGACVLLLALDAVALPSGIVPHENGRHAAAKSPAASPSLSSLAVMTLLLPLGVGLYLSLGAIGNLQDRDTDSIRQMSSVEQYAIEHPDQLFMHDYSISNIYNSYDPFRVYPNKDLSNLVISGGSYTFSGPYYRQLEANGIESFLGERLLEDDVFYISDPSKGNYVNKVLAYLRGLYGDVDVVEVEQLDGGATVYKFFRP